MNLNFGSLSFLTTFLLGTFRSVLKVNEFTLAGAALAGSLAEVQAKRNGGEPTHSSPKSATFSKEYNTPAKPERIQYAQGTLRPCSPRAMASYCLILVAESVEVSDRGQEQNSASCVQADCYKNNKPCSKTMRQAHAGRRRERSSCSRRRNCRSFR